jgi:hypothetical protein
MNGITSYLQAGRLADVLALIQVLAYDRDTSRTEEGLDDELQRKPAVGGSWMNLAVQHPEFFRVRAEPAKTKRVSLLARYVLPYEQLPEGGEKRPSLDVSVTNKLMELAIELHDKEAERAARWRTVMLPLVVAVIPALASIVGAYFVATKPATPTVVQLSMPSIASPVTTVPTASTPSPSK